MSCEHRTGKLKIVIQTARQYEVADGRPIPQTTEGTPLEFHFVCANCDYGQWFRGDSELPAWLAAYIAQTDALTIEEEEI